jgi:predicted RNA-binding Zn-ribbon protein involved in translation (DUF1610 family)
MLFIKPDEYHSCAPVIQPRSAFVTFACPFAIFAVKSAELNRKGAKKTQSSQSD